MFTQLLTMPPIPLNQAREEIRYRPEVEAAVMRGLAKQPKDRFGSVLEFAVELERTLALPEENPGVIDKLLRRFSRKPDRKR
jgi:hypothetical protein